MQVFRFAAVYVAAVKGNVGFTVGDLKQFFHDLLGQFQLSSESSDPIPLLGIHNDFLAIGIYKMPPPLHATHGSTIGRSKHVLCHKLPIRCECALGTRTRDVVLLEAALQRLVFLYGPVPTSHRTLSWTFRLRLLPHRIDQINIAAPAGHQIVHL